MSPERTPAGPQKAMVLIELKECPRNLLFRHRLEDWLKANGFSLLINSNVKAVDLSDCRYIFFATCATMVPIRDEQLRYISIARREIQRQASPAELVVTGCLPYIEPESVARIHDGPLIGHRETEELDRLISARVPLASIPNRHHVPDPGRKRNLIYSPEFIDKHAQLDWLISGLPALTGLKPQTNMIHRYQKYSPGFQSLSGDIEPTPVREETWLVTISTGCLSRCSYCNVWRSRGRLKSRPLETILAEIQEGLTRGFAWISMIADDNGVYGADIGSSFGELLAAVTGLEGEFGLMIEGVKPADFNAALPQLMAWARTGRPLSAMLSLQHANSRILKSMGRPCDMELFKSNFQALARACPGFVPGFHSMVGYPGETEAEFEELARFVRWLKGLNLPGGYSWVSFVFSPNPGTPASALPDQIPEQVRIERGRRLTEIHEGRS